MIFVQEPAGGGRLQHPAPFESVDELKQYLSSKGIPQDYLSTLTYSDPSSGKSGPLDSLINQTPATATPPATPPPVAPPPASPIPGGGPVPPGTQLSTPAQPVNQSTVPNTDISPYIPATSEQQQNIINQAIAQSQSVGQQNVQSLQDILGPYTMAQVKNWTDPNSPDYQSTIGSLNNFGRADAGTFGQSLSSRLAPLLAQNQKDLGTGALLPSFLTQQGLVNSGAGIQSGIGLAPLQRFINTQDWQKNATLAQQLADKGVPSNFQQGAGTASSILGGVGDFFQGFPGMKQASDATSYVCLELIKRGLLCESDMDDFHAHIMPAMFKKGRAFWMYARLGRTLVNAVNAKRLDWRKFKPLLFDRVMAESDACKAVNLYADACRQLCELAIPELWDKKIMRTSVFDSLPFIPKLAFYKPFVKAFFKCLRMKMLIISDKPKCVHAK